jgi:phosphatidylglycerophosphate synthase
MFDHFLRKVKEVYFVQLAHLVARTGITPTQLTLIGFGFGLFSFGAVATGQILYATLFWWLGRFCDGLDGTLARTTNQQSDFGGYVGELEA